MTERVIIGDAGKETRIYALCEFPSQIPRYVGKTIHPLFVRLRGHLRASRRQHRLPVARWLAKREAEGAQVCIKWIETVPAGADWAERESFWIDAYKKQGFALLNMTSGGEGLAGHKFTQEHKDKIAAAIRSGSKFSCLACGDVFYRKKSAIEKGQNKFCSRACGNKHNRGGWDARKNRNR
jgi:hypothetical protein